MSYNKTSNKFCRVSFSTLISEKLFFYFTIYKSKLPKNVQMLDCNYLLDSYYAKYYNPMNYMVTYTTICNEFSYKTLCQFSKYN